MAAVKKLLYAVLSTALLISAGCASRPVLYPNDYYKKVGQERAEQDVDEALRTAKEYKLKTHRHGDDLKDTTTSSAVGAAAGAAAGAVGGATGASVGVGAAAGAAGGAAAGTTNTFFRWIFGSSDPPPAYRSFVERYLREKGYDVIGWE